MKTVETDEKLLSKLAFGDKETIESIYKNNYDMIETYIIKNSGTQDDARDIFQESMIVIFEKAKKGDLVLHCQLKTFIYAISKRLWLKKLQQIKRFYPALDNNDDTSIADEEMSQFEKRNLDIAVMENALNKIGEPCKSIIEAFYIENKSMPEIATIFGYTNTDNAKNQKYKCLMRLKKIFFAHHKNLPEHG